MLFINHYSHIPFLKSELKQLLPDGSFASRLRRSIGNELHYLLVDWPDESETEFSSLSPVDTLYFWATTDGGFDPEWLASEDGSYLDDDGEVIPPSVKPSYSAVEQLAAYGLWMLDEMLECLGPIPKDDADIRSPDPERCKGFDGCNAFENCQGWKREEVIEHRAACLLLSYQSLSYCQRILSGTKLTAEEIELAMRLNYSEMGKAGALRSHAPMARLRSWAIERYQAGKWKSANQAAHSLRDSIIEHGRTINANLTEQNAQRTIAEWFRKSV